MPEQPLAMHEIRGRRDVLRGDEVTAGQSLPGRSTNGRTLRSRVLNALFRRRRG